eukprot:1725113-Rhodomonas_salina.1
MSEEYQPDGVFRRPSYAMPGTKFVYAMLPAYEQPPELFRPGLPSVLKSPYAMSGIDTAYRAMSPHPTTLCAAGTELAYGATSRR